MASERTHDLVLFGASGFTGALTAEYLADHAPADLRWALAGRNLDKLEALRGRLAARNAALAELPLLRADVTEPGSIREMAAAARAVVTTVGPYISYGEPLVEACAQEGTDYLDLTGEPEFVDLMYVRHHERAVRTGARIVHSCGLDSIPPDLGVQFTVQQLPEGVPLDVEGFLRTKGALSGGTLATTLTAFSRLRQYASIARERRAMEPRPADRRVRLNRAPPRYESELGAWVLPMPTIDPQVIGRSARALERYGPDFSYGYYLAVKRLPVAAGLVSGAAGLMALAQLPPARNWLLGRRPPGSGPSPEQIEKGWFKVRFVGEGGGRRVVTEVAGGDPGYGESAKMLAESALCLLNDELPNTAGQVTTAVAMGDALRERLQRAGIGFSVLEAD